MKLFVLFFLLFSYFFNNNYAYSTEEEYREDISDVPPWGRKILNGVASYLTWYHNYKAVGLDQIPSEGPVILVSNHSQYTFELFPLGQAIMKEKGRLYRPLIHDAFFWPPLGHFFSKLGWIQANPKKARWHLQEKKSLIGVLPGGVREEIRATSKEENKYKFIWEYEKEDGKTKRRDGFLRLAFDMEPKPRIFMVACPAADDVYDLIDNRITNFVFQKFGLPLPLTRGRFGILLYSFINFPRPRPLISVVKELKLKPSTDEETIDQAFLRATNTMQEAIDEALKLGRGHTSSQSPQAKINLNDVVNNIMSNVPKSSLSYNELQASLTDVLQVVLEKLDSEHGLEHIEVEQASSSWFLLKTLLNLKLENFKQLGLELFTRSYSADFKGNIDFANKMIRFLTLYATNLGCPHLLSKMIPEFAAKYIQQNDRMRRAIDGLLAFNDKVVLPAGGICGSAIGVISYPFVQGIGRILKRYNPELLAHPKSH